MKYLEALELAHYVLGPKRYLEIGCRHGHSLQLATCPTVAVDPELAPNRILPSPNRFFVETSDAFFARPDIGEILDPPPDLVFIDGMHLVEFALRDFLNSERNASEHSVVLIDDVLPRRIAWSSRFRRTRWWTGDTYRLIPLLRERRPDLEIEVFSIAGKGLAVISRLNPSDRRLSEDYEKVAADLENQRYVASSAKKLRKIQAPRHPRFLAGHLQKLRNRYSGGSRRERKTTQLEESYLELTKKVLLNETYLEDELRLLYLQRCAQGKEDYKSDSFLSPRTSLPGQLEALRAARDIGQVYERDLHNASVCHTMMGRKRLDSLHQCLETIRDEKIPGDLMECGVWRGGGCILMAAFLSTYEMPGRRVFVVDSFKGLPRPRLQQDRNLDLSKDQFPELAVSLETVQANFAAYGLLDDNIVFVEGWFQETVETIETEQIALLRLDGDLYESTLVCLEALYDRVALGGLVIVDDYGALAACREAVKDFFERRQEPLPEMVEIDWTGVYWKKFH